MLLARESSTSRRKNLWRKESGMHTLLAFAVAVSLAGTELPEPREGAVTDRSRKATVVEQPRAPQVEPILKQVEQREVRQDVAATQQQVPRGSFWWMVGVIVVAGVILAVIL
jgi:hypothetical protein